MKGPYFGIVSPVTVLCTTYTAIWLYIHIHIAIYIAVYIEDIAEADVYKLLALI